MTIKVQKMPFWYTNFQQQKSPYISWEGGHPHPPPGNASESENNPLLQTTAAYGSSE